MDPRPADRRPNVTRRTFWRREGPGWGALIVITGTVISLATLRPVGSAGGDAVRLFQGVDRYQAAMDEGRGLLSRVVAEFKRRSDPELKESLYEALAKAILHFDTAVAQADALYEVRRARISQAKAYLIWSRELYGHGTATWPPDRERLERALLKVEEGLRLPHVPSTGRAQLEALRDRIDRGLESAPLE